MDERWVSAVCRGVHDGVDDLTSGANAGVRPTNGSQVLRWSATTASSAPIQTNDDRLKPELWPRLTPKPIYDFAG